MKPSLLWFLVSVLHVNGSSDHQQFFWHGFTMSEFFILWIFRLPSFGYQAVLSNKCSCIFYFPEPFHLNYTWGHPLFSQNSALLSSTMNIMKSDTSLIFFFFFFTLVGDFSLLPRCLKHSSSFKFRCLTRKYIYIKYSKSEFLGIQCFPSDCRFSSFFTSGTCSYLTALGTSSLSFAGFSLCGISRVLKC